MHIKYHMDRNSCLCNALVQAVATKLVYSSSIYCTYLVFSTVSSSNYVLLDKRTSYYLILGKDF